VSLLSIQNLAVGYGYLQVIQDVSLDLAEGEVVALLGGNGAGKTTTIRAIMGLLPPWGGEILFAGQPLQQLKTPAIVARGLSYVPEGKSVFPKMTVLENLELAVNSPEAKNLKSQTLREVFDLFPRLADPNKQKQLAGTLSGGEQRMLVVARGLMARPRLLLLDEPSLGLAPKLVQDLFAAIREIHLLGMSIFLVEQNVHLSLQLAGRGYVLEHGRIVLAGKGSELAEMEHVKQAYLGM
jgi:branched-chain amino acid transport system ATP-binding protein